MALSRTSPSDRQATALRGRFRFRWSQTSVCSDSSRGIVNLNPQISDGALELCMPQEQLDGSEILHPLVNQRRLCAPQRMGAVSPRVQLDPRYPGLHDPCILSRRDVRRSSQAASEEELTRLCRLPMLFPATDTLGLKHRGFASDSF
jgi:hypothetical protein